MKNRLTLLAKCITIFLTVCLLLASQGIEDHFKYTFFLKSNMIINLFTINNRVNTISAEPSNKLFLRVEVRSTNGNPVSNTPVNFKLDQALGNVYPSKVRTDKYGEAVLTYVPPDQSKIKADKKTYIKIKAQIYNTSMSEALDILLVKPPVVLIHGYQEHPEIFDNIKEYLLTKAYDPIAFGYTSEEGVIAASNKFEAFLQNRKAEYLQEGIQVNKFDIIAHSMGGLVARYYSCSSAYLKNNNIEKIIFISVPHKGSYWATIGINYFNDQGVKDLMPESKLINMDLPVMFNKGLNDKIQAGSILGQYDEVVSPESASLDEWNIKTEVFNVGENSLSMNNILNGNLLEASNHKNVLFNEKVFEKIVEMLDKDLQYPSSRTD